MFKLTNEDFARIFPFEKPRKHQREIIEGIIGAYEAGIKHVVLSAPTGIGKSIIGISVANYFDSAYILTSQKMLQAQYVKDFQIPELKGKSNYPCSVFPEFNCDDAPCEKTDTKNCPCVYKKFRDDLYINSTVGILNYAIFLRMGFTPLQQPRKLLVMDEAHGISAMLVDVCSSVISEKEMLKHGINFNVIKNFPQPNDQDEAKLKWLFDEVQPAFEVELDREAEILKSMDHKERGWTEQSKKVKYFFNACDKLNKLKAEYLEGRPSVITQDEKERKISFKLLYSGPVARKYLTRFGERTLSMSATILSKETYCQDMNFDPKETIFIQAPAIFPKENRPIYIKSVGSLSYKNKWQTLPKLVRAVEEILEKHVGQRGIIHTVSYEFAQYIIQNISSKYKKRLVMPKGVTRQQDLEKVLSSSSKDVVLISPSLTEGIDLKDDLSRFTIVCKLPFGCLGDRWIKRRMEISQQWYNENTIISLMQMTGRSVRTETDKADAYILDSDWLWFYKYNQRLMPQWWKESIKHQ
ncbi:MAG TPA: helicase C-terminal domain-containing protein [Saccharofermentans sp.]|nr:helicase C-terminal domain-containing protein [Saccharofermentans sp.]